MKKTLILLFATFFGLSYLNAQRYIIRFKDKGFSTNTLANPSAYLSARAIERRQRFSISVDSTDLPVTTSYIDSLKIVPGVTVLNVSRWLNQVSIKITDGAALIKINNYPFVHSASRIASRLKADEITVEKNEEQSPLAITKLSTTHTGDVFNYGSTQAQVKIHNGDFLHNIGLRGQNMIIGMLDAGYDNYTNMSSFDSIRTNGQILGTWDFVDNNANVADDNSHGALCFSILGANVPGFFVGTAPKASYYLYRTEDAYTETPLEEHNWVCGAERIDSAGGNLISSSLGYMVFDDASLNYTYADMNGNTTMIARGADLAAKKGLLVVNAAGNSGNDGWHYIISPADGDNVLAVGSVNASGVSSGFSSYGPSSDAQVKPDVASIGQGTAIQYPNGGFGFGNGTSLACPNMAGLVTCLMQGFPEFNNMKIINAVRKAGSIASAPDNRIGFGIPDMKKAVLSLIKDFAVTDAVVTNCRTTINWTSKDMAAMKYEVERKAVNETAFIKIGELQGTGNFFSNHTYHYTDTTSTISAGVYTYRIKQIIDTASASIMGDFIDTVSTEIGSLCTLNEPIVLAPNPAKNHFFLHINLPQKIDNLIIRIVSMQGINVDVIKKSKPAGIVDINIPTLHLKNGQYYVMIYDGSILLSTKKLLKL